MSHKIESSRSPLAVAGVRSSSSSSIGRTATPTATNAGDSLRVTDHARLATRVIQSAREAPDLDSQRVGNVRTAVDNGSYVVNSALVASRMLQQEWQLST